MTHWQSVKWWFRRLVIQRLNGERKAAREYQSMLDKGRERMRAEPMFTPEQVAQMGTTGAEFVAAMDEARREGRFPYQPKKPPQEPCADPACPVVLMHTHPWLSA